MLVVNNIIQRICLDPVLENDYRLVNINVGRTDNLLSQDGLFYVGANGKGGSPEKYLRAKQFLESNNPIYAPILALYKDSCKKISIGLIDGRHRFACLRDMGLKEFPIAIKESMITLAKFLDLIKK